MIQYSAAPAVKSMSRSVLDTPHARGMTVHWAAKHSLPLAIAAFPIKAKRSMVPRGFVIGKCRLSIDIKGLAEVPRLWRAV
jgi:hypothetical protein